MHVEAAAAEIADWPDVTTVEIISPDNLTHRLAQFLWRVGNFESVDFRGRIKTIEMRVETKDGRSLRRFIAAQPLKHTAAIMQRVRGNMRGRARPRHKAAVHPHQFRLLESHRFIAD